ncbi:MAG: hypothetical protein RDU89_05160 [bacterium]|nr:hypothetical protein [bacterium]
MRRLAIILLALLAASGGCRSRVAVDREAEPPPEFAFALTPAALDLHPVEQQPNRLVIHLFLPDGAKVSTVEPQGDELLVRLEHAGPVSSYQPTPVIALWMGAEPQQYVLRCDFPAGTELPTQVRFTDLAGNFLEQRLDFESALAVAREEIGPCFRRGDFSAFTLEPGCRPAWRFDLCGQVLNARGDALVAGSVVVDAMTGDILEHPRSERYPTRTWLRETGRLWPAGLLPDGRLLLEVLASGLRLALSAEGDLEQLPGSPRPEFPTQPGGPIGWELSHDYTWAESEGAGLLLTLTGPDGAVVDLAQRLLAIDDYLGGYSLSGQQWTPPAGIPRPCSSLSTLCSRPTLRGGTAGSSATTWPPERWMNSSACPTGRSSTSSAITEWWPSR